MYTTYRLLSDDIEAFRSLAMRMTATASSRDGCAFLDVAQDVSDPATFRLIEGWRDQAALNAHGASEEFQAVLKDAAAVGIVGRSIDIYSIAGKKTVELPLQSRGGLNPAGRAWPVLKGGRSSSLRSVLTDPSDHRRR